MMRRFACLVALLAVTSCADSAQKLRIGVKAFTEQTIVAEMVRARLQAARLPVDRLVPCKTTAGCQQAMADGAVDILIEYTGTAAAFSPTLSGPGADTFARVAPAMAKRGQTWLAPLGFDNGYRVLVTPERARHLTDLAGLADIKPLRVVAPAEFMSRPRDGWGALATRYGLSVARRPLLIEAPIARFAALRDGRGDVAIGYATDGAIDDFQLVALTDSADFFPSYAAAVVVRSTRLTPRIEAALRPLSGQISTETMRQLNAAVELEGLQPAAVARRFLMQEELLKPGGAVDQTAAPLTVATGPLFAATARRITREAFAGRPVRIIDTDPRAALAGGARLAVLSADQLLKTPNAVAVAVIGRNWVHAVRRAPGAVDGTIGVEPTATAALKARAARIASAPTLFAAVRTGELDVALVHAPLGDPGIKDALASGLMLVPVQRALPLHQPARLPAGTYPGQTTVIETRSTQVLLAGPARQKLAQASGPSGAIGSGAAPLTAHQRDAIRRAARVPELPDPALPHATDAPQLKTAHGWLDGVLNLLVVLFLAWWVRGVLAPVKPRST